MKHFAESEFDSYVYINFDTDLKYHSIFQESKGAQGQGEHFKLYLPDIGLMRTKSEFPIELLKHDDKSHNQIKGTLAETYVLQELKLLFKGIYYSADKHYKIDYLIQYSGKIWPIEVKFGKNIASKSLKAILEKHTDLIGIRYSQQNLSLDGRILNIPLYMISETKRIIDEIDLLR